MEVRKTGIINDCRMLKHKSKRSHPEKPQRVERIMDQLQKTGYLQNPRVEFISSFQRQALNQQLEYVYPSKYIQYISNLWPKESHRRDLTVLDTYFCEYSEEASRLAVGATLLGIDKVINHQWENGFAVVRPPGHHSGARNTINGFCVFNNVAIGARYLQKKYGVKKVAILDWDIHLGDGTHEIFVEDPSVLFISVHRYDNGSYYPAGELGGTRSCGRGEGQGSKLNVPLNYVDKNFKRYQFQAPGDNQYIYLYHRIVEPIIKEFDPEFILVSSGFDASRFDPLGGFTVTPNGFYYMARRLAALKKPLLAVLEGGYNVEQTALDSVAVVKGLLQEERLPEQQSKLSFQELAQNCHLEPIYLNHFDEVIAHHSKYWKSLEAPELVQYTNLVKKNTSKFFGVIKETDSSSDSEEEETKPEVPEPQQAPQQKVSEDQKSKANNEEASALTSKQAQPQSKDSSDEECTNQFYFAVGHMQRFKNFSLNNEKLLKWAYPEEALFYEKQYPEVQFAPKYFGREGDYIILENLLYQQEDHIVADFKLSRHSKKPGITQRRAKKQIKKEELSTSGKYAFRLCGFTTPTYKEGGLLVDDVFLRKVLAKVVSPQNKALFCDFLTRLADTLRGVNRRYYNTSILIAKGKHKSEIRWIDFHYWHDGCESFDADLVEGIENLKQFISEVDTSSL